MAQVYILVSLRDHRTYIGHTADINKRFRDHSTGRVPATCHRRPFKVFHLENFNSIEEAKKRELWWKSGAGRRKLKKIFKEKELLWQR